MFSTIRSKVWGMTKQSFPTVMIITVCVMCLALGRFSVSFQPARGDGTRAVEATLGSILPAAKEAVKDVVKDVKEGIKEPIHAAAEKVAKVTEPTPAPKIVLPPVIIPPPPPQESISEKVVAPIPNTQPFPDAPLANAFRRK